VKRSTPSIRITKPESIFQKPVTFKAKEAFKALGKAIGHTIAGKWEELASDATEAIAAIGLETTPSELGYILIQRAIIRALFDVICESASQQLADSSTDPDSILAEMDFTSLEQDDSIDNRFIDNPANISFVRRVQALLQQWLIGISLTPHVASAISNRFPTYFVYALNQEWRKNSKSYKPLIDSINTPFSRAGEREWAWAAYRAQLERRTQESIFGEPFSLAQIYIPLNAYYEETSEDDVVPRTRARRRRVVVSLHQELKEWATNTQPGNALRVLSGGPGSGKSSFARIFAAEVAAEEQIRVLFVPLHLIDPSKDLVDEVGRFVRDEGVLVHNPLDSEARESNLLLIFDGLDELSSQGKAAAETARGFIREIERTIERRNGTAVRLRVLLSGREVSVQDNDSEFRRPKQVLTILPYFQATNTSKAGLYQETDYYDDADDLLRIDLRKAWWKQFGSLTGKGYKSLPVALAREDLTEVTAQPLLNYLIALSFTRDKIDFTEKNINLNLIYEDLVAAVHERGYEKHRRHGSIRHVTAQQFLRVLEEVGLAAWHGDGRTTTVMEIERHCRSSGLSNHLEAFQEGAKAGVTRLLAAFFFRKYGERSSGDPTFVFTHKSFGEYLAARRVIRGIDRVATELNSRDSNPDRGWDDRDALRHWATICGPSAITGYLFPFLINEARLRPTEEITNWQGQLSRLFSFVLQYGMPIDQMQGANFRDALFQARNAEEALLVALNLCSTITQKVSNIEHPDPTAFGAWFKRIQGQRAGPESVIAASCVSHLNLDGTFLAMGDFYRANFQSSSLRNVHAEFACFMLANLSDAILDGGSLTGASFEGSNLYGTSLAGSKMNNCNLHSADLRRANLTNANLTGSNLRDIKLERALLSGAKIPKARRKGSVDSGQSKMAPNKDTPEPVLPGD